MATLIVLGPSATGTFAAGLAIFDSLLAFTVTSVAKRRTRQG
jgi:hypothetical protein